MVFLRAILIAVGITSIAASATASSMRGRVLLGGENRTATTAAAQEVFAGAPRLWSYCGADIVGGDTFVKRYPSPDDCVTNCLPSTGCNAGTWTKFEGGTCYFKRVTKAQSAYLNIVPNVGAVSFLLIDDTTPSEVPYAGLNVDMPGNDFANTQTADSVQCYNLCARAERCNACTYRAGTCYLKTKSSPLVALSGATSAIAPHSRNAAACLAFM